MNNFTNTTKRLREDSHEEKVFKQLNSLNSLNLFKEEINLEVAQVIKEKFYKFENEQGLHHVAKRQKIEAEEKLVESNYHRKELQNKQKRD